MPQYHFRILVGVSPLLLPRATVFAATVPPQWWNGTLSYSCAPPPVPKCPQGCPKICWQRNCGAEPGERQSSTWSVHRRSRANRVCGEKVAMVGTSCPHGEVSIMIFCDGGLWYGREPRPMETRNGRGARLGRMRRCTARGLRTESPPPRVRRRGRTAARSRPARGRTCLT